MNVTFSTSTLEPSQDMELESLGKSSLVSLAESIKIVSRVKTVWDRLPRPGEPSARQAFLEDPNDKQAIKKAIQLEKGKERWMYQCELARHWLMCSEPSLALEELLMCEEENKTLFLLKGEVYEKLGFPYVAYNQYQKALSSMEKSDPLHGMVQKKIESLEKQLLKDFSNKEIMNRFELSVLVTIDSFLSDLEEQAQKGDPKAKTNLAYLYVKGIGVEKNVAKGVKLYEEARNTEYAPSMPEMGDCYLLGNGVEKNSDTAVSLFEEAIQHGFVESKCRLAYCYHYGYGVNKDPNRVYQLYKEATDSGVLDGLYGLGFCYENGTGVTQDSKRAKEFYEQADNLGDFLGTYSLITWYRMNEPDLKSTPQKVLMLCRKAVDFGSEEARMRLALCYAKGYGTGKKPEKAMEILRELATSDNTEVLYYLARCYFFGIGFTKDGAKAFILFQKAAAFNHHSAMAHLADCYKDGIGTEIDQEKAFKYYKKAAALGSKRAYRRLGVCYAEGIGTAILRNSKPQTPAGTEK